MSNYTHPCTRLAVILALLAAALSACTPPPQATQMPSVVESARNPGGGQEAGVAPQAPAPAQSANAAPSPWKQPDQQQKRIILKNASLSVVVPDPGKSLDKISAMAEAMGGFVVEGKVSKQYIGDGIEVPHANLTIRIPAERLNEALKTIEAESTQEPKDVSISSQDVTSDYIDLQSRQANLEAAEKELVRIMEGATRTEDVMNVYNQLVSIREQIETIKGQIKYYDQAAALSSIAIDLIADKAVQPIKIAGWEPTGVAKEAIQALISTLQGLATLVIWSVLFLLPVLLVLSVIFILPIVLVVRAVRKRRAAQAVIAPPQPPSPEA